MKLKKLFVTLSISMAISAVLIACSDDKPVQPQAVEKKEAFNPFDHSKDPKITKSEKEEFEKVFAEKCIKDEMEANPGSERRTFERPCNCIGTYLMKDLTAQEAEKFVKEHENPVSLTFKENAAVYHCVQENAPPKDSGFSHPAVQQ